MADFEEIDTSQLQPLQRENIRLAATVMLIRDADEGLEVYMVKRPGRGDFPDLHVFPGGKVDEADLDASVCYDLNDKDASSRLGIAAGGVRYWVAVARECFEECGVLIARPSQEVPAENTLDFDNPAIKAKYENYREEVLADSLSFSDMCTKEGLMVSCDALGYFSHWLTPEMAPRRFDTRFFLAAMPGGQVTHAHTGETADDTWVAPGTALQRFREGEWQMIDPTIRSLETLSQFSDVAGALAGVREGNHLMKLTPELSRQGMQPLR